MVGITVAGTTVIVAVGSSGLTQTRQQAALAQSEQSMTLVDSRAAEVALGGASTQSVPLGDGGGGQYSVDSDAGWLRITHVNYTDPAQNETVYNASLGSLVYENGDTTVAYQGGGVWRTQDNGTVMLSPPEFHYMGSTLTLPIVRVRGDGGGGGSMPKATVSSSSSARHVFPNTTVPDPTVDGEGAPYDEGNAPYANPVENGTVYVTVNSEHYRGWKQYFETRTDGEVFVSGPNQVTVVLVVTGQVGPFRVPAETDSREVRGMPTSGKPVSNFSLTLEADNTGRNFENLHWSMYQDGANQDFELHVHSEDKCSGDEYNGELDVSVYYRDAGQSRYEGWQNSSIDPQETSYFSVDCSDYTLDANFSGNVPLEYKAIDLSGNENKWYFGSAIKGRDVAPQTTMYGTTYDSGVDSAPMSDVINHYFTTLAPRFSLTVADGPGGSSRIAESGSYGGLYYSGGTYRYITYLHVTENEVDVRIQ